MTMVTSRTFKSGDSEALLLPAEVAYGLGVELTIVKSGDMLTIYPKRHPEQSVAEMIRKLRELPRPSSVQKREEIEIPERDGL
ncbi:MAG: antitoxin [Caulobacteraceae bacterium]